MESRLETVELKLMDLELVIEQLNDVVIRQQQSIDELTTKIEEYKRQVEAQASPLATQAEETPPPHY